MLVDVDFVFDAREHLRGSFLELHDIECTGEKQTHTASPSGNRPTCLASALWMSSCVGQYLSQEVLKRAQHSHQIFN